jgi:hypothetical protein
LQYNSFSHNTRNQIKQVFDALRELTTPPELPKPWQPIEFATPQDKGTKGRARGKT